ncbi:hypothetical protein DFH07DRAFT_193943 [Mycena maculata]|uniref:Secreted protein n=1 Tax=Mycena maculata TaxID=230809 RepID=A0AAD7KDY3_9AGAR|nr:hypothetical protein DFH07DRAFT_193943 [Mycena maculata]
MRIFCPALPSLCFFPLAYAGSLWVSLLQTSGYGFGRARVPAFPDPDFPVACPLRREVQVGWDGRSSRTHTVPFLLFRFRTQHTHRFLCMQKLNEDIIIGIYVH